jgi:Kef-type K+ transport system membrane component KefB
MNWLWRILSWPAFIILIIFGLNQTEKTVNVFVELIKWIIYLAIILFLLYVLYNVLISNKNNK